LLDGMLVDYLARHDRAQELAGLSIRERSVLQLGRAVNFEETHARTVARLALELFDSAQSAGLHELSSRERELLYYAALLHDAGTFISYSNHQNHTYYLVHNADLLGFDEAEIELIATTALFHRRSGPGKKNAEFAALDKDDQETVRVLSMLLRLAESLDRSHVGVVKSARLSAPGRKSACLEISAENDCTLEVNGLKPHLDTFEKVFGKSLEVKQLDPAA